MEITIKPRKNERRSPEEKSLNMTYFPGELNSSALRSYFIKWEVYDHNTDKIMTESATLWFIKSPKRHRGKEKLWREHKITREIKHVCDTRVLLKIYFVNVCDVQLWACRTVTFRDKT